MLNQIIENLKTPNLLDRQSMLDMLLKEEYGYIPPKPDHIQFEKEMPKGYKYFLGGKASFEKVLIKTKFKDESFSFPITVTSPKKPGKHPFLVFLSFKTAPSGIYFPCEEIIDNGFGLVQLYYNDVTSDDGDFTNGLAGVLYKNGKRNPHDPGKIAMWAWAASRVVDYLETLDCVDMSKVTVCGHSRLGKTALLAAAVDERFYCAHSNDSGCSGASLARNNKGETVKAICDNFPYWFCENYKKYVDNENAMPFDQHFLIASVAPRKVYVSSADEDLWADPENEYLSCALASDAFEKGFVHPDRFPQTGEKFHDGDIGYHIRKGLHFYSREDWLLLMEFLKNKKD